MYPHYVLDAAIRTNVPFVWSDKLLTPEDAKLERLKFAILFTIADMFWVKTTRRMHVIRRYKKLETEISFTLHSPLFFHSPLQKLIHHGVPIHPVKKHWFKTSKCFKFWIPELSQKREAKFITECGIMSST